MTSTNSFHNSANTKKSDSTVKAFPTVTNKQHLQSWNWPHTRLIAHYTLYSGALVTELPHAFNTDGWEIHTASIKLCVLLINSQRRFIVRGSPTLSTKLQFLGINILTSTLKILHIRVNSQNAIHFQSIEVLCEMIEFERAARHHMFASCECEGV